MKRYICQDCKLPSRTFTLSANIDYVPVENKSGTISFDFGPIEYISCCKHCRSQNLKEIE